MDKCPTTTKTPRETEEGSEVHQESMRANRVTQPGLLHRGHEHDFPRIIGIDIDIMQHFYNLAVFFSAWVG